MGKIDVSVNLCTYNRLNMLRRTLRSLLDQQTDGTFSYEIVVVDDGSSDATPEFIRGYADEAPLPIRYFREERVGVAAARNRGVRESSGKWIAFIDDDEKAEPGWLQELMTAARASRADCVAGPVELWLSNEEPFAATCRKNLGETHRQGWLKRRLTYSGPGTCNALVRRTLFDAIGSFDPLLAVRGEDQDFFRRARSAGCRTVFAPKALVYHFMPAHRLQPAYLLDLAKQHGRSLAYFDCREWGCLKSTFIGVMRLGHAMAKTIAFFFFYPFKGKGHKFVDIKCSLYTALAYVRELIMQATYVRFDSL